MVYTRGASAAAEGLRDGRAGGWRDQVFSAATEGGLLALPGVFCMPSSWWSTASSVWVASATPHPKDLSGH